MTRLALSAALILTGALEPTRLHSEPSGVKRYGTAVSSRPVLTVMHRSRRPPLLSRPSRSQDRRPVSAWTRLAACESGGNWHDKAGMFDGGLQFLPSTWLAYGGGRYARHAYDATRTQQVTIARRVLSATGWGAWPVCSRMVGLR